MTTAAAPSEFTVRYDGSAVGTEIWGMTQANFLVQTPGRNPKEVAVMLNDAAARVLARELGQEDTPDFRREAAHHAGQYFVQKLVDTGKHLWSAITLSEGVLDEYPDILDYLQRTKA